MWSSKPWNPTVDAVGYKKPPTHSRFKPGQSGNPKGRSRKRKGSAQLLQEVLDATCIVSEKGVAKKISLQQLVYKVLVANAVKGQPRASAQLFKLMHDYGMLKGMDFAVNEMVIKFVGAHSEKKTSA